MLVYDIALERLKGEIGGTVVNVVAASGGGRGSRIHPHGQPDQVGPGSWDTKRKASKALRGGPLPPGIYIVRKPRTEPRLHGILAAELEQTLLSLVQLDPESPVGVSVTNRSGFFIHGRGPRGSDGCIVPKVDADFRRLMRLLEAHAPLMLKVENAGTGGSGRVGAGKTPA